MTGYTGGGLRHADWCHIHWDCCGVCKCGSQDLADRETSASSSPERGGK